MVVLDQDAFIQAEAVVDADARAHCVFESAQAGAWSCACRRAALWPLHRPRPGPSRWRRRSAWPRSQRTRSAGQQPRPAVDDGDAVAVDAALGFASILTSIAGFRISRKQAMPPSRAGNDTGLARNEPPFSGAHRGGQRFASVVKDRRSGRGSSSEARTTDSSRASKGREGHGSGSLRG